MDNYSVVNYRFTMSPDGTWTRDGDRCTYVGPCLLEQEFYCQGSLLYFPGKDEPRMVSVTIPAVNAPPTPDIAAAVQSPVFPAVTPMTDSDDACLPSCFGKRKVVDMDAIAAMDGVGPSKRPRTDGAGPSRVRRLDGVESSSPSPRDVGQEATVAEVDEDDLFDSEGRLRDVLDPAPEPLEASEEKELVLAREDSDDCVELIDIESSIEVVDLVTDSEEEEQDDTDPSDGSFVPGV